MEVKIILPEWDGEDEVEAVEEEREEHACGNCMECLGLWDGDF